MHLWITGSPIPIPFLWTTLFRCVGGVRYVSRISDLRFAFWPPKPKKLSFWKHTSWKLGFRFLIRFFVQLYLDVWEVCVTVRGYWMYGLRFDPPNRKKLNFSKPMSWKCCFHSSLDNWESDSDSVSSYNFILMCGRCALCFNDIGSTIFVLTP